MGFGEYAFPSASHSRYSHSIGAMAVATRMVNQILPRGPKRFIAVTRLAALLHDLGHGPLSHATEFAMPQAKELGSRWAKSDRAASHEDYTLKMIVDSDLSALIKKRGQELGFGPEHVAALIDGNATVRDNFFHESVDGVSVDFRPLLHQVISSELDADRLDYLRRDSLYSGVSYGNIDADWLVSNLAYCVKDKRAHLALKHRALYAFDDFLLSRFNMFLMVYFHYKAVVYDEMLVRYFHSKEADYRLPPDIQGYLACQDGQLFEAISRSKNEWARRIVEKRPYKMLIEVHSGIPARESAAKEQRDLMHSIQGELARKGTPFLLVTTTGELSRYLRKPTHPIFVAYDNRISPVAHIPLQECTEVFQRYPETRSISRIYIPPEQYREIKTELVGTCLPQSLNS